MRLYLVYVLLLPVFIASRSCNNHDANSDVVTANVDHEHMWSRQPDTCRHGYILPEILTGRVGGEGTLQACL